MGYAHSCGTQVKVWLKIVSWRCPSRPSIRDLKGVQQVVLVRKRFHAKVRAWCLACPPPVALVGVKCPKPFRYYATVVRRWNF
jgi:hypothetical protein